MEICSYLLLFLLGKFEIAQYLIFNSPWHPSIAKYITCDRTLFFKTAFIQKAFFSHLGSRLDFHPRQLLHDSFPSLWNVRNCKPREPAEANTKQRGSTDWDFITIRSLALFRICSGEGFGLK